MKHPFEEGFSIVAEESELTWPSKRLILGVCVEVFDKKVEVHLRKGKEWEAVAILEVLINDVWYYNSTFKDFSTTEIMAEVLKLGSQKIILINEHDFAYNYVRSLLFYIITNDYPNDYYKKIEIKKYSDLK